MNRAVVLIMCLAAAGAVAGYTHYSQQRVEQTPVFTVHVRHSAAESPPPASNPPQHKAVAMPGDRASIARALQRELKRVGCYGGDINGVWTTSSRMAMKSFTDHVNAALPIDTPDQVLLSLVQGRQDRVCDASCPPGQTASESGCMTNAALTQPQPDGTSKETTVGPIEKSTTAAGSVAPTTAAAATALAATAVISKAGKAGSRDNEARASAATQDEPRPKGAGPERSARHGGPVPPERVHERRPRRYSNRSRPPKLVRNILRAFGIR